VQTEVEERAWLAAARTGDSEAFGMIVQRYQARLLSYVSQLCGNPSDAEDLVQDSFVKAHRALNRFDGRCSFGAWVFTIAKNHTLNHLRGNWRHSGEEVPESIEERTPADSLDDTDHRHQLWEAAKQLKPAQFEALWLRYGEGFNIEEVARIMKTNRLRVRVLLHRGRQALTKALARNGFKPAAFSREEQS
jgi:RNA polymerase sigma-70 factor (ECF subfamily)